MANTRNFSNKEVVASDEQLCYIPCNFCNIVLAVNVPCSKLFDIVKVKCEYCNNMWPVNMCTVAGFHHPHPNHTSQDSSSRFDDQVLKNTSSSSKFDLGSSSRDIPKKPPSSSIINDQKTVNQTPEKRKRAPSAYNKFMKQEIRRVKANNPHISHREAFSAAAKNWAHFPHIQTLEANNHQEKLEERSHMQGSNKRLKSTTKSFNI